MSFIGGLHFSDKPLYDIVKAGEGVELAKVEENDGTVASYVASNEALKAALADAEVAKIVLTSDLKATTLIKPSRALVIDLGGHKLESEATGTVYNANKNVMAIVDGVKLTFKNGSIGDDFNNLSFAVYSSNDNSETILENITFGRNITYAYNNIGKLTAVGCKFHGWMSGWHSGGKFTNCEFGVGKAYFAATICYGDTTFDGCKFFKNGKDKEKDYTGTDSDGYYRCNFVISVCKPTQTVSCTDCKFIDNDGNETTVSASDHPFKSGWGNGTPATRATITVDGNPVTL